MSHDTKEALALVDEINAIERMKKVLERCLARIELDIEIFEPDDDLLQSQTAVLYEIARLDDKLSQIDRQLGRLANGEDVR